MCEAHYSTGNGQIRGQIEDGLDWIGLDWIGLKTDWIGLDWIGLDWLEDGLDWLEDGGLDWIGLENRHQRRTCVCVCMIHYFFLPRSVPIIINPGSRIQTGYYNYLLCYSCTTHFHFRNGKTRNPNAPARWKPTS